MTNSTQATDPDHPAAEVTADPAAEADEQQQRDLETLATVRAQHEPESPKSGESKGKDDAAPATSTKKTSGDAATADAANKAQYEQAVTTLLSEGVLDQDEIEAMDPTRVIAKAEAAQKRLEQIQSLQDQLEQLTSKDTPKSKDSGDKPQPKSADTSAESTAGATEGEFDAASLVAPVVNVLRDAILDDESALEQPLTQMVQQLHTAMAQQVATQLQAMRDQNQQLTSALEQMTDGNHRSAVAERFPQVNDDAAWDAVRAKASELMEAKIAPDRAQALRAAAGMLHGFDAGRQAQQARDWKLQLRSQQPEAGDQSDKRPGGHGANPDDADRSVLSALRSGKPLEQVRRESGVA